MSKQTATEWLFKKLWDEPKDKLTWYAILDRAEEIHKQEILLAYNQGSDDLENLEYSPLKYYDKTFNK
jgi:hypothetical protein